jgi:hypothetical protein
MQYRYGIKRVHGRISNRTYEKGETYPLYGIARQLETGEYEFMNDYGNWGEGACIWADPPYHYIEKRYSEGAFIVNFRKKNAPQPKYYIR